jgi:hypothetical protein
MMGLPKKTKTNKKQFKPYISVGFFLMSFTANFSGTGNTITSISSDHIFVWELREVIFLVFALAMEIYVEVEPSRHKVTFNTSPRAISYHFPFCYMELIFHSIF